MDIDDIIYNADGSVTVVYSDGRRVTSTQTGGSSSPGATGTGSTSTGSTGTGIFGQILGAIPGILSAIFPQGAAGSNNAPVVYTNPTNGNTEVTMSGTNNFLLIGLVLIAGYFLLSGTQLKPARKR